jgi:hypothetical protein
MREHWKKASKLNHSKTEKNGTCGKSLSAIEVAARTLFQLQISFGCIATSEGICKTIGAPFYAVCYADTFFCKKFRQLVSKLGELASKLDNILGVGFSKATKILHTRYPRIVPIVDNLLQKEYKSLKSDWKKGDWYRLFKDYYGNFLVKETYNNLCKVYTDLSFLNLTKVRIFDILWWSFLKSKNLIKVINWTTIRQIR